MDEPFGSVDARTKATLHEELLDIVAVDSERPRDRTADAFTDTKADVLAYFE
jgi:hypothetical protein